MNVTPIQLGAVINSSENPDDEVATAPSWFWETAIRLVLQAFAPSLMTRSKDGLRCGKQATYLNPTYAGIIFHCTQLLTSESKSHNLG
jgi:hypothetical protein